MKRILLALALLPLMSIAQSGKIIYEENFKMDMTEQIKRLEEMDGMDEMIKKLQDASSKSKKTLEMKDGVSLYRNFDETSDAETSWTSEDGGMEMKIVMMRPESKFYRNASEKLFVEQQDLWGKMFIINEKDVAAPAWKISPEQAQIGKYLCQKASYTKDSSTVTAWFTTQIPASFGPQAFHGLPGLILKVEAMNGMLTIEAKDINLEAKIDKIVKPVKGKEVTREAFEKIRAEKLAEMREMRGGQGGGRMHIEVERD